MKFCLGTAQFGFPYGLDKSYYKNIDRKFQNIIKWNAKYKFFNYIDTAFNYGNAEKIIGKNLKKRDKIKIISKFSYTKNKYTFDNLVKNLHHSLESLNVDSYYGILVHEKSMFKKDRLDTTIKLLKYIEKNNISKKIGISVYDKTELDRNLGYFNFDIVQLPLNIFNQSFNDNNYLEKISKKYEVFVRSIFLQGLLLNNSINSHNYFKKYNAEFVKYKKFLNVHNFSPAEACIYYIYSLNLKIKTILGVNDLSNLKEITKIVNKVDKKKISKINFSELNSKKNKLINPSLWDLK